MAFAHLHLHSEFSLLDGATKIDDLVVKVKEMGQLAVAVTDHGWLAGAIKLTKACEEHDIKPIVGSEVYVATQANAEDPAEGPGDNYHLTVLCQSREGYMNLVRLTSGAYTQGLSYKPRIDLATLARNSNGLIVLSGCIGAELPAHIIRHDTKRAEKLVAFYQKAFRGRFFIELMAHGSVNGVDHVHIKDDDGDVVMEETDVNDELVRLAKKYGVATVATNDAHYLNRDHGDAQDTLICLGMGKYKDEPGRMRFPGAEVGAWEFFVKSEKEMLAASDAAYWPEACRNTMEVVGMVERSVIPMGETRLPTFKIPDDPGFRIWKRCGVVV